MNSKLGSKFEKGHNVLALLKLAAFQIIRPNTIGSSRQSNRGEGFVALSGTGMLCR